MSVTQAARVYQFGAHIKKIVHDGLIAGMVYQCMYASIHSQWVYFQLFSYKLEAQ